MYPKKNNFPGKIKYDKNLKEFYCRMNVIIK